MPPVAKAKTNGTVKAEQIEIMPLEINTVRLNIIGDTPLMVNKWSDKAKEMMLAKQMKKASSGKEAKNPEQMYNDARYIIEFEDAKHDCFPALAFKASTVDAANMLDLTKVGMRSAYHIFGEAGTANQYCVLKYDGDAPIMSEDMVRIAMGTADIRYRPLYPNWSTTVVVHFNKRMISLEQLVNLFNAAGFGIGIGEWRPKGKMSSGINGMFHCEVPEELQTKKKS